MLGKEIFVMIYIQSCYGRQTHVGAGLKQKSPYIHRKTAT